ncbi:MAG: glutathione S-transferase family protein, partial [Deltaproteobacteria bacterium]|nr:glutathione S-transferase family protein [Deltaproteobacteria bacterium]
MCNAAYRVHGMAQSYFTRKLTGYFDYKNIPWVLRRSGGTDPDLMAAGFPGGIPAVHTPTGELMWDTTSMIHYLERCVPVPSIFPDDAALRFLDYVIEDFCDEWLYRPAVGTRWSFAENAAVAGYELARDLTVQAPVTCDQAHMMIGAHVRSTCPSLGVTPDNIQSWVDQILRPWLRALGRHFDNHPFLFGGRPSLADFAIFGGNVAHFVNDPLCRRWADEDAPAVVRHTHRLLEPEDMEYGDWNAGDLPLSLLDLLAEIGRVYLPWVSRACVEGAADLVFDDGARVTIRATDFLRDARSVLLARYGASRSDTLDGILAETGLLPFFA